MSHARDALRFVFKQPSLTTVVAAMLALGIGGATAMFSAVQGVLLKPLPYERPGELVWMFGAFRQADSASVSPPDFLDYRTRQHVFRSLGAMVIAPTTVNVARPSGPERLSMATVSAGLLSTLGVSPILGRDFQRDEEESATEAPVIISERLWRAEFASSPQVLGRTMRVEDRVRTVVGVMPDGFALPFDPFIRLTDPVDLYAPIAFDDSENQVRRFHFLRLIGRLGSGVSMREAQAQMDTIARQLEAAYTENETWKLRLVSLHERMVGDLRRVLFVLFGAVLLLLLVACANVAGLLLARGVQRQNELALRVALGASRRRIFAQLMLESLLLALLGAIGGGVLALWLVALMKRLGPSDVPRLSSLSVDWTVVLFAILLIAATTVLFGAVPAFHACRQDAADALRQGFRSTGARRRTVLRNGYVVTQIAVACALLAAAGLFVRSLWRLEAVDPGFATRGVVLSQLSLSRASFDTDAKLASWYAALIGRLSAMPGVEAVALASGPPLVGGGDSAVHPEGHAPVSDAERRFAQLRYVDGQYFLALGMRVVAGRAFTPSDRLGTPPVVVISETMARQFFGKRNAVGERLVIDGVQSTAAEVVGIVADARLFGQTSAAPSTMYLSSRQWPLSTTHVVLRVASPSIAGQMLQSAVRSLDRTVAVGRVQSLDTLLEESVAQPRFRTVLAVLFAGLALALTLGGLYGSVSWAVTQRTREFGIRCAIGARPRQLLTMVLRQGISVVACGALLGIGGAIVCGRLVRELLYDTRPFEPIILGGVTCLLAAFAILTMIAPAMRAARADPAVTLRSE